MKAIRIMPGEEPEVIETTGEYSELSSIIGGIVEYVRLSNNLMLLCDEEFKLKDMTLNRRVGNINIAGPIILTGYSEDVEGYLSTLTENQIQELMEEYKEIPEFTKEEQDAVSVMNTMIITW